MAKMLPPNNVSLHKLSQEEGISKSTLCLWRAEALFQTCKYVPSWPARGYATIEEARAWVHAFVRGYNTEHRHSAIRFVTPDARHRGEDLPELRTRQELYQAARTKHPARWSRKTRNWDPVGSIWLNTERPIEKRHCRGDAYAVLHEAGRGPPWLDTSEMQRERSSDDNYFDEHPE